MNSNLDCDDINGVSKNYTSHFNNETPSTSEERILENAQDENDEIHDRKRRSVVKFVKEV